ncbi:MAG TPA: hypothetical protein VGS60_05555 [Actinomycetes bacterium]|nr:hypothetical protein [Actinomycetes bacterium]
MTRRITYQGSVPIVRALVQALEAEGVTVSLRRGGQPTMEERDTRTIVENVVAILVAEGGVARIKAGVRKFRANFPRAKVEIEGEDDGEPMFHKGRMRDPCRSLRATFVGRSSGPSSHTAWLEFSSAPRSSDGWPCR